MISAAQVGKTRRMQRLISPVSGRMVLVPLDDSLISGPKIGMDRMDTKIDQIIRGAPDAIMGFPGLFRNYSHLLSHVPGIMNVTASTIRSQHTHKTVVSSVSQAVQFGMDAIGVHVNIGSKYETEMLGILGSTAKECENYGMPLLAIMYPRTEGKNGDDNYDEIKEKDPREYAEYVAHAVRVGSELGADIIKTQYTGDPASFRFVVQSCEPVPILIAGGPPIPYVSMLKNAYDAISAGASGVSFGRNVFTRNNSGEIITALKAIVHNNATPEEAIQLIKESS